MRSDRGTSLLQARILIKEPRSREVKEKDSFRFNDGFTDPHFRIKVNSIQMKETEEENTKVNDAVMQVSAEGNKLLNCKGSIRCSEL